ncbi:MAG: dTDP-4-dehydrorhamnose reductase [Flavobacteriaceae bacterium]
MITLVTGSNGQLGKTIQSILKNNSKFIFTDKNSLDITKKKKIESVIKSYDINCIVNCAAYTHVDQAEIEKEKVDELNCNAVKNLVEISETYKLRLIHISTDYVYNGINRSAISEYEYVDPQNYYGVSKLNGEKHIENSISESIVIRTSWLYSSFGKNFVKTILEKAKSESLLKIVGDQYGCPTNAHDLADAIIQIIKSKDRVDKESKIYNFSNLGYTSWFEFAKVILEEINFNCNLEEIKTNEISQLSKRPKFAITNKTKIMSAFNLKIPEWKESLMKFLKKI